MLLALMAVGEGLAFYVHFIQYTCSSLAMYYLHAKPLLHACMYNMSIVAVGRQLFQIFISAHLQVLEYMFSGEIQLVTWDHSLTMGLSLPITLIHSIVFALPVVLIL